MRRKGPAEKWFLLRRRRSGAIALKGFNSSKRTPRLESDLRGGRGRSCGILHGTSMKVKSFQLQGGRSEKEVETSLSQVVT